MNQVLVACEAGHCPHEAGIGSWKSYEVGCIHLVRSIVVLVWTDFASSLMGWWCFTNKCSLLVWLITAQCKL